jgi:hypothetical protein
VTQVLPWRLVRYWISVCPKYMLGISEIVIRAVNVAGGVGPSS